MRLSWAFGLSFCGFPAHFFSSPCNNLPYCAFRLVRRPDMETASQEIDVQSLLMTPPTEFAALYERHYETVFRTALRVMGNPSDAEDVLQTVFLRILNQGGRFDPALASAAYFRRAAANAAVDLLRRRSVHAESAFDEAAPHCCPRKPGAAERTTAAGQSRPSRQTMRSCFFSVMWKDFPTGNWPGCSDWKRTTSRYGCTVFG